MSNTLWEHKIRQHTAAVKFSLASGNHGVLDAAIAVNLTQPTGALYAADLAESTRKLLTDHGEELTSRGKEEYDQKEREWERIKDERNPDKASWQEKIKAGSVELKRRLDQLVDDGTEVILRKIGELPEGQRDSAADGWTVTLDIIGKFFTQIWEGIQRIWDAISKFFENLWEEIKKVGQEIADGFNKAVSWIRGLFGFSYAGYNIGYSSGYNNNNNNNSAYTSRYTTGVSDQTIQIPRSLLPPDLQSLLEKAAQNGSDKSRYGNGSIKVKSAARNGYSTENGYSSQTQYPVQGNGNLSARNTSQGWVIDNNVY